MAGSFFAFANILAGVLHYAFQVLASREMLASDFALFSVWLAKISVLSMLGGLLQYAGNFFPSTKIQAERSLLVSVVLTFIFSIAWLGLPRESYYLQGTLIILSAGLFGWILGQIQQRMLFLLMGVLNLSLALSKLTFVFLPGTFATSLERFSYAVLFCYFSALLIVFLVSRTRGFEITGSPKSLRLHNSWTLWLAPLILSAAGALIPQMDIIVLEKWQPAEVFHVFVRASLFYKGIYFLMFIFAQWMLPQQISKKGSKAQKGILTYKFGGIALLGSALVAIFAPFVGEFILRWEWSPPRELVFYSCLSMSLLTWIFLLIQESCAQGFLKLAGFSLAAIIGLLGVQLLLKPEVNNYFQISVIYYLLLAVIMVRTILNKPASSL